MRSVSLLAAVVLATAACGGGATGVTPPPPPGTTGTVIGTVSVAATRAGVPHAAVPALPLRTGLDRPVYVPNQIMVKFRPGVASTTATGLHAQAGGTVLRTIQRLDVQVVRLAPGVTAAAAMNTYRASGLVEYVEQDAYAYRTVEPTDPMYFSQWHYPQIGLPAAWDITTGGPVIVAVLDTGIRTDHEDLGGVTVTGYDFVTHTTNGDGDGRDSDPTDPGCPTVAPNEFSHGTHVSGTVAARTNNGIGVAGVNWGGASGTKIMALRVLGQIMPPDGPNDCGTGYYSDIADAIIYAADRGAKVINMSLGGPGGSTVVDNAITYARGLGVTLVAAAGNNSCGPVIYPARNPNVIAVAATTITNERAPYSSCGPEIDVAAPGGSSGAGVLSTTWRPSDGFTYPYRSFQGTSMATPHVAGLVALMISRGITGPATIQSVLQSTATDLGTPGFDTQFGWGLVNAAAAVSGGAASTRMRAFSGVIVGSAITRQSDLVTVADSGAFTITNAQTGTKSVFIWQDFNANGLVDTGDYFGQRDGVVINSGATTDVGSVTVQRYGGAPITVTGP